MKLWNVKYKYVTTNRDIRSATKVLEANTAQDARETAIILLTTQHQYFTINNVDEFINESKQESI